MGNIVFVILGLIVVGLVGGMVVVFLQRILPRAGMTDGGASLAASSQDALKRVSEQFLMLAEERLKTEHAKFSGNIETRKHEIESIVDKLQEQLARYEAMVKEFEGDRLKKYSSLEQQLSQTAQATEKLHDTTAHLTSILGNVKRRGQWGERMAEDILKYCGLQEGIHFEKQKTLDSNTLRPDYTFFLPDDHKVVMDVKFPLNRYLEYVNSTNDGEREQLKKSFLEDVRSRIREVANKDYLPAADNTLDYVLLFIPNEQVYGFINEEQPGLIDESLAKKIILCSPWTLYAVLRIIWQAWTNYHHAEGLKKIITLIYEFKEEFSKFREQMDSVGEKIEKAQEAFQKLSGVRTRQLDKKMEKIEQYGMGNSLLEQSSRPSDQTTEKDMIA